MGTPRTILVVAILLAAVLRFHNLDWKLYGFDENVTSVRAAGHTLADLHAFAHDGRPHTLLDLKRFAGYDPASSAAAVVASLAREDPQHPPPFFLLHRAIVAALGDGVGVRRLASAVFGVALVAAVWWLALELFALPRVAAAAAVLVAVSPFHVAYAQQAREYSLFALLTCLASAQLLRAQRFGGTARYVGYGLLAALGLWTFPLFALVVVAHAVFTTFAMPRTARAPFWITACAAAATFAPWAVVMVRGAGTTLRDTSWQAQSLTPLLFAGKWVFNAGAVFFDLDYITLAWLPVTFIALLVAGYAMFRCTRDAPRYAVAFLGALAVVNLVALLVPDIAQHSTRSLATRYLTPLWLAVELATAYGLTVGVQKLALARRLALAFLFIAGFVSCEVSAYARSWWLADTDAAIPGIAAQLAILDRPSIVATGDDAYLLELATLVDGSTPFSLHDRVDAAAIHGNPHPYVVARGSEATALAAPGVLQPITVPRLFPSRSTGVQKLRATAAAGRGTSTDAATVRLWSVALR
jgi:uncharacterized membrane protein